MNVLSIRYFLSLANASVKYFYDYAQIIKRRPNEYSITHKHTHSGDGYWGIYPEIMR